jgi:hypothetical protein
MVNIYGVAAGRLHWDPVVALVSGASESLHRRGSDPHVSGISAYTAMISAVKIGHFGYSEALMITLLTNFLKASSIVGALSIGLSGQDYGCIANVHAFNGTLSLMPCREGISPHLLLSFFSVLL